LETHKADSISQLIRLTIIILLPLQMGFHSKLLSKYQLKDFLCSSHALQTLKSLV